MTEGQYLIVTMLSAAVLLGILQFLKRRFLQNEPSDELYNEQPDEFHKEIVRPATTNSAHMS